MVVRLHPHVSCRESGPADGDVSKFQVPSSPQRGPHWEKSGQATLVSEALVHSLRSTEGREHGTRMTASRLLHRQRLLCHSVTAARGSLRGVRPAAVWT
jgi:hypothetical protein